MKTLHTFLVFIFLLTTAQAQETEAPLGSEGTSEIDATLSGNTSSEGFTVKNLSGTTLFRVRGDGNVGIGTFTPGKLLDINGSARASSFIGRLNASNMSYNYVPVFRANISADLDALSNSSIFVKSSGDVGIGTTSPTAKLNVTGGSDVTLTAGGDIMTGIASSSNIAIDGNEIMARNNGSISTLYLNAVGGTVFHGGDAQVTGNFTYNSAKTRYVTVSHAAFNMAMTTTAAHTHYTFSSTSTLLVRTQGGSSSTTCYLSAPIYIPDGATVTQMDAFMFDSNSSFNATVKLIRHTWNSLTRVVMAEASTSSTTGQQTITDSSIGSSVINMASYAYFLLFVTKEASTNLGLYNVRITYTVNKAD